MTDREKVKAAFEACRLWEMADASEQAGAIKFLAETLGYSRDRARHILRRYLDWTQAVTSAAVAETEPA